MIKPERIFEGINAWALYLIALLLPSFFLPITSDWLEWNKHYLLGILVIVALLAWLTQGLFTKKLTITRTPFDLPLAIFWVVLLIASILSKDRIVSFFGAADNVSTGFLAFTFYSLLALLVASSVRTERMLSRLVFFLGIGGGATALYFWLARFGLFKVWGNYLPQNEVSSLLSHFGVTMAILATLALGVLLMRSIRGAQLVTWTVIALLSVVTMTAIGYQVIWIAGAIGFFLLLVLSFSRLEEVRYPVVSLIMVFFVGSLVFLILGVPSFLTVSTATEITIGHRISLQMTFDTLKEGTRRLFFGSGPGTFVYDFSTHRPASFNLNPVWNYRFPSPAGSSYDLLATSGILGALSFILILLVGAGTVLAGWVKRGASKLKSTGGNGFFFALAAVWLTLAIMLFIIPFGTTFWTYFFVTLALLPITLELAGIAPVKNFTLSLKASPQYALATSFIYIVVMTAVVLGGVFLGRFYAADVLAVQSARAASSRQFDRAENLLVKTLTLNPYRFAYDIQSAQTLLGDASVESQKEKPDGARIGTLFGAAINISRRAANIAPLDVRAWEQLSTLYADARPISKEANGWAITSLNEAIKLEPTNPQFYMNRAIAYGIDTKNDEAEADVRKAIELKSDFAQAHYQLSLVLEAKKDLDGSVKEAVTAVQLAPQALDAQLNLGRMLVNRNKEGDWTNAEQVFRGILSVNKDYANALYSLGLLLEKEGKIDSARTQFRRVLELDPSNKEVQNHLDNMGGTPKKP